MTPTLSPWCRTARSMRERVDAAMDHMADLIKDALLDGLDLSDEDDEFVTLPAPIDPDEFVSRMRERVERALRQVAQVLNDAPDESRAYTEEATRELLTELWLEALKVAAEVRLDAALGEARPAEAPHGAGAPEGEWARRYRLMHADDPE
ncbi:MAG TPA: hypothetical protein VFW33_23575 [Gemmataceae bacterium]|nr:hypothetical protein [Gemmataceae bacterium]